MESDRGQGREKTDHYHNYRERSHDCDQEREREYDRMRDQEREREYDHMHDDDRSRDRFVDGERTHEHNKGLENIARVRERSHDYDWGRELETAIIRSHSADRGKRSRSSELNDDGYGEVENQLEISKKKLQELQEEISQIEELADEKKENVLKLQDRVQNLEDSLSDAKKGTSLRKMQLSKFLVEST